jgi:HSP20 family protein
MFELLRSIQNGHDFGTLGEATADVARPLVGWAAATSTPPADVHETADAIRVLIDLPGYSADSINISFENELLSIEAERKRATDSNKTMLVGERAFGKVRRTFGVKVPVDADAIAADYEHGVLAVTLPKRAEAKPRRIAVQVK